MSEGSSPSRYLILFGFLLFPFLVVAAVFYLLPPQNPAAETPEFLSIVKYILLILSVGDCLVPWLLQKQAGSLSSSAGNLALQGISGDRITLIGYFFNISGIVYGFIFYLLGMSRLDLYPFAAISLAGTLLWGLSRLRKSEEMS